MKKVERVGVDFDGTAVKYLPGSFAEYDPAKFGEDIPEMIARMKKWMSQGKEVVIFTARVYPSHEAEAEIARDAIQGWSLKTFGRVLEVTCMKDPYMIQIWDDKAVAVERDTGRVITEGIKNEESDCSDAIGSFLGV
jgi:hypothetical protein